VPSVTVGVALVVVGFGAALVGEARLEGRVRLCELRGDATPTGSFGIWSGIALVLVGVVSLIAGVLV
jgi:hypothetical protein